MALAEWSKVLAIMAPFGIAAGGLILADLAGRVPVMMLTLWRAIIPIVPLGLLGFLTGGWGALEGGGILPLLFSGIVGVVIADAAFNGSIYVVGARLGTLIFSLNAPFAAVLGYVILNEAVSVADCFGLLLVLSGITIAVKYRPRGGRENAALLNSRRLILGLAIGMLAAFAQASSAVIGRPVMADGADPFVAMCLRLMAGTAVLLLLRIMLPSIFAATPIRGQDARLCIFASLVGIGIGVTCVFAALSGGDVAMVITLSSLTPIAVLPMIWWKFQVTPPWPTWAGAILAFAGSALIINW